MVLPHWSQILVPQSQVWKAPGWGYTPAKYQYNYALKAAKRKNILTCMNPVFLSVVPAARRRGEQGTQATAATVAWEQILVKIFCLWSVKV